MHEDNSEKASSVLQNKIKTTLQPKDYISIVLGLIITLFILWAIMHEKVYDKSDLYGRWAINVDASVDHLMKMQKFKGQEQVEITPELVELTKRQIQQSLGNMVIIIKPTTITMKNQLSELIPALPVSYTVRKTYDANFTLKTSEGKDLFFQFRRSGDLLLKHSRSV